MTLDTTMQDYLASIVPNGLKDDPVIDAYRDDFNKQRMKIQHLVNRVPSTAELPEDFETILRETMDRHGVARYGVTELQSEFLFNSNLDISSAKTLIILVEPMAYEKMKSSPSLESGREIIRSYRDLGEKVAEVALDLESRGISVLPHHPMGLMNEFHYVLFPPHAVAAGLGEQGRTGLFLDYEFGSLVRLAAISTDVPHKYGSPKDRGISAFCRRCNFCAKNCPVHAIPEQTYAAVDFDESKLEFKIIGNRCIKYFEKHYGCGKCLFKCVFAQPNKERVIDRVGRVENWYKKWEETGEMIEMKKKVLEKLNKEPTS